MNESADKWRIGGNRKLKALKQRQQEMEWFRHEIFLHAKELASEMNLRLLLDGEVDPRGEERMLFVESVVVTGIAYPVEHRTGFLDSIKLLLKRIFTYMTWLLRPKHGAAGSRVHSVPVHSHFTK